MIRVRYPNGVVLTYNRANYLCHHQHHQELSYKDKNDETTHIATVLNSSGAVIEFEDPCSINKFHDLEGALQAVLNELRSITSHRGANMLAELKAALREFDSRRKSWK